MIAGIKGYLNMPRWVLNVRSQELDAIWLNRHFVLVFSIV